MLFLAMALLVSLGAYLFYNIMEDVFPVKKFLITIASFIGGIILIGLLLYFLLSKLSSSSSNDTNYNTDLVSTKDAREIFLEEFMLDNDIETITPHWGNKKLIPLNKNAIEIRNKKAFVDPNGQTSDKFFLMELFVYEGKKTGAMIVILPLDLGKQFLRDNWDYHITWDKTFNIFDLMPKKYPMTNNKDFAKRFGAMKLNLLEEGYSDSDVDNKLTPYMMAQEVNPPVVAIPKQPKIKSPNFSDNYNSSSNTSSKDNNDEDEGMTDIEYANETWVNQQ